MSTAIEIASLSKTFKNRGRPPVKAVDDLNLRVPAGQVFGFLGANGAGKTTTIKMACGLVVPTAGQVSLNGYDVQRQRSMAMRQVGAVLEGTRNVYWRLTAWQNLMYFSRLKGCAGPMAKARAQQLLQELDLWGRRHDPVRSYSRGMQQKVAIACALVADPPIVLLDEPTLGLDVQAARTVKQWIASLAREQGKTVVLTTHQLDMAQELCDRVAIMREGKLIADQPVGELLELFRQEYYEIRIRGHVDGRMPVDWEGISATPAENGDTILSAPIRSEDDLYRMIDRLREMGLSLVSINQVEPGLQDVFIHLMDR